MTEMDSAFLGWRPAPTTNGPSDDLRGFDGAGTRSAADARVAVRIKRMHRSTIFAYVYSSICAAVQSARGLILTGMPDSSTLGVQARVSDWSRRMPWPTRATSRACVPGAGLCGSRSSEARFHTLVEQILAVMNHTVLPEPRRPRAATISVAIP